MNKQTNKQTN